MSITRTTEVSIFFANGVFRIDNRVVLEPIAEFANRQLAFPPFFTFRQPWKTYSSWRSTSPAKLTVYRAV
jgi:hypothetical protein